MTSEGLELIILQFDEKKESTFSVKNIWLCQVVLKLAAAQDRGAKDKGGVGKGKTPKLPHPPKSEKLL